MQLHETQHDTPLALIGLPGSAARFLRELGLVTVSVPSAPLPELLTACRQLRFSGALFAPELAVAVYPLCAPDSQARRAGTVDALSFGAEAHGTFALEDALLRAVEASGYPVRGSRALLIGEGQMLRTAVSLARLGLTELSVAASSAGEAQQQLGFLPAGTRAHALSLYDEALPALAERADLIVLASGNLPGGVLQPYHTVLNLSGVGSAALAQQVSVLDTSELAVQRLSLQLEYATGERFTLEALQPVAQALSPA